MTKDEMYRTVCNSVASEIHDWVDSNLVRYADHAGIVGLRVSALVRQRDGTYSTVTLTGGKTDEIIAALDDPEMGSKEGADSVEDYHVDYRGGPRLPGWR
jgi:hypothetical protein